jgi:hypothetical protein
MIFIGDTVSHVFNMTIEGKVIGERFVETGMLSEGGTTEKMRILILSTKNKGIVEIPAHEARKHR